MYIVALPFIIHTCPQGCIQTQKFNLHPLGERHSKVYLIFIHLRKIGLLEQYWEMIIRKEFLTNNNILKLESMIYFKM